MTQTKALTAALARRRHQIGGPGQEAVRAAVGVEPQGGPVCLVAGTRPEVIKLAPVYHALRESGVATSFIFTGQHGEMAKSALRTFGIAPDASFVATRDGVTLSDIQSVILKELKTIFDDVKPSLVLVQGDTTTALTGAMAAFNAKLPIGHVEAGLTTGNLYNPYPEEMNRALIARLATCHYAPTERAAQHLQRMGVDPAHIIVTGNTVVDAVQAMAASSVDLPPGTVSLRQDAPWILVTTHRREAWGAGLDAICGAVLKIADAHPDKDIIWPVHSNPQVRDRVHARMADHPTIHLLAPLDYPAFIALMAKADLILTDSGGVQEEAPSLGVPCLIMRESTERPEAVESGLAQIVGHDPYVIIRAAERMLADNELKARLGAKSNPFGDGLAGARIAQSIEQLLGFRASAAE